MTTAETIEAINDIAARYTALGGLYPGVSLATRKPFAVSGQRALPLMVDEAALARLSENACYRVTPEVAAWARALLAETPLPPDQEPPDADTSPEPANDTVEDIDPESETPAGLEPRED